MLSIHSEAVIYNSELKKNVMERTRKRTQKTIRKKKEKTFEVSFCSFLFLQSSRAVHAIMLKH
jgi:Pyruvate/2-oxoacid:ferredoxin oxidoreductase gamma subunit